MQPAVAQLRTIPPVAAVHIHPLPEVAALHPEVMAAEAAAEGADDAVAGQEAGAEANISQAARRAKRRARRAAKVLQVGSKGSSRQHKPVRGLAMGCALLTQKMQDCSSSSALSLDCQAWQATAAHRTGLQACVGWQLCSAAASESEGMLKSPAGHGNVLHTPGSTR